MPQKDELESGASNQKKESEEAPWKQRVKVEEIWLQNNKNPVFHTDLIKTKDESFETSISDVQNKTEAEDCTISIPDKSQNLSMHDDGSAEKVSVEHVDDIKPTVNGNEEATRTVEEDLLFMAHAAVQTSSKKKDEKLQEWDVLNVKNPQEITTLAQGVHNIAEPHITEHKSFKPEDPAYTQYVKKHFVRPPPSLYLNESVLSMRKRRSTDETPTPKYTYNRFKKRNEVKKGQQKVVVPEPIVRQRCDKCRVFFSSLEEFQKHQALNTCSSLFGFDSDDDS